MRFADYVKCGTCNWRYGNIFHVCIANASKTVEYPKKKKRAGAFFTESHREAISESNRRRWARIREQQSARDQKLVDRYLEGQVGMKAVAKEFGIAYQTARDIIHRAGVARPVGRNVRFPKSA